MKKIKAIFCSLFLVVGVKAVASALPPVNIEHKSCDVVVASGHYLGVSYFHRIENGATQLEHDLTAKGYNVIASYSIGGLQDQVAIYQMAWENDTLTLVFRDGVVEGQANQYTCMMQMELKDSWNGGISVFKEYREEYTLNPFFDGCSLLYTLLVKHIPNCLTK